VLGWFVGLILLWSSDAWGTREKLLGTLLFPGGLLLPLGLGLLASESSGCGTIVNPQLSPQQGPVDCPPADGTAFWEIALVAILILVPIVMAVYLARRIRPMASPLAA
jgi:FtsH-binding integral membrane protein